jgi:Flp pilus assembly protein CpaB
MSSPSELTQKLPPGLGSRKFLSTRRGTITLAVLAGAAALAVLLVFMNNYRESVRSGATDARVLVADRFIDTGTSGDVIAEAGLFKPVEVTDSDEVDGAITDPSAIAGQVATEPIYRGQQLTADAFTSGADPIAGKLEGTERALTIPVGDAKGNVQQLEPGSRVDVLGSINADQNGSGLPPMLDVLARDILVLGVPAGDDSSIAQDEDQQVVVRVGDVEASRIAFAADHGDIWLTVRPPTLGEDSKMGPVRPEDLIGQATIPLGG